MELRKIHNFPDYKISDAGMVWSDLSNKFLKPCVNSGGYYLVTLVKNKKHYSKMLHSLLLETFVSLRPVGYCCRHLDGNKLNNQLKNLCWGTYKENVQDEIRLGRLKVGEQNTNSKLTESIVKLIFHAYHDGAYNQYELARHFQISRSAVCDIVSKRRWQHVWAT